MEPIFLDREDILEAHEEHLHLYGGGPGIRDFGGLEAAVAQPSSGFGDSYFHVDLEAMAAAYLFHITQAHAFVDGNKRVGLWAALTFLRINGIRINARWQDLVKLTLDVATGKYSTEEVAGYFRSCPREKD